MVRKLANEGAGNRKGEGKIREVGTLEADKKLIKFCFVFSKKYLGRNMGLKQEYKQIYNDEVKIQ